MASVNKVILVGRVGQDPDIKYTQDGKAVARISLATSKKIKGEERTSWHSCSFFGRVAEICQQYVGKGDLLYIDGEIEYNKKDDRVYTNIIGYHLQMLGSKGSKPVEQPADYEKAKGGDYDDIPFAPVDWRAS